MKKQNIKFLLVLLVFGILLAWTTHAQQTPEQIEIAKKARNSTVRLVSEWNGHPIGDGSGFFVEHNQIVTNIHVVAGADKVAVKLVGKETGYTIEGVTAFDAKNDLVILQTTEKNGKPLTLRDSNSIEPGTSIFAVGTPKDGEEGHITQGTFHSVRKSDGKLRLKTIISPGNSGGPVLSWKKAEAIGVVVASSGKINVSYAIPSNILRELLKRRRSDDDAKPLHEWWQRNPAIFAYLNFRVASEESTDDTQKVENAIEYLNKVIEDNPHLADDAYEHKGRLLLHGLRDHQAAIENLEKLIELMPDYSVGYYHLGMALGISTDLESAAKAKIPQYKRAIDNFTESIRLIPFADAYFHRGLANRALGQCRFTLGQSKDDQENRLSLYEAAVRDLDKAIIDQEEAIELKKIMWDIDHVEAIKKDYADTYHRRGYMKLMVAEELHIRENKKEAQRLYEAAVEDCKEAIRINPNLKTDVQQMQKRAEEALEQLKR